MAARLSVCLLIPACLLAQQQQPQPARRGELQRAVDEFKTLTRDLGFREDSPKQASRSAGRRAQFHGRLFENFRNDFIDAVPHEIAQRGESKSLLRRNQFGFNVSGPVIIPRLYNGSRATFFSLSYEGVRERISRSYLRTVPIAPERGGDYSLVVDNSGAPLEIFDPASVRLNPQFNPSQPVSRDNLQYLKDPFPSNAIPAARQDRVARNILSYYPQPNSNAGPFFRNNYFVVSPETNAANGMIAKVDHTFLEKHRLAVSFAFTNGLAGSAVFIPNAADSAPADRNYTNRRGSIEHVYTISPQTINTATVEAHTDVSDNVSDLSGWPSKLGLTGVPGQAFPFVSLGGYLPVGRASPVARNVRNTFVFTDAHSVKTGSHNIRLVGQFVRYQINTLSPAMPSGAFYFSSGYTGLPGIVNTGQPFASFLLGGVDSSDYSLVPSPSYFRNWSMITAVQDTWEVRQGFTVSFGLNMLTSAPRVERYDRQSMVDLAVTNPANNRPGALVFAGHAGYGRAFQPIAVKPQPNASFSWNPRGNRKAVLRASYGMSYQAYLIYNGQWGTRGFTGHPYYYSPNSQLAPAFFLRDGVPPPARPVPDLTPIAANDTNANLFDRNARLPRYQSAGVSYEREVPGSIVVTGSLGLAWGRDLFIGNNGVNLNSLRPEMMGLHRDKLNNVEFNRSLRPLPQFLGVDIFSQWPDGRYRREAASLRVEKRTSQGLPLNATYEYSRQYDDYSGPYGKQDFFNRHNEWGLTAGNNPQRLSLTYMYELPIGTSKPYLVFPDWRRYLTDGWSISGISSVSSGDPISLRAQFNNTGGVLQTVRVNVVPGVDPLPANQGPDMWFNPAAFSHPDDFEMGSGPRTHPTLRNPMTQNHDLSVGKRFAIDQERSMEFTASGF
ncbi:MAG: hypothetical protein HZB13_10740, partial [Acidobacteria bacterium]|nr:hypothetical protein [Acidobacteriota bacterium]